MFSFIMSTNYSRIRTLPRISVILEEPIEPIDTEEHATENNKLTENHIQVYQQCGKPRVSVNVRRVLIQNALNTRANWIKQHQAGKYTKKDKKNNQKADTQSSVKGPLISNKVGANSRLEVRKCTIKFRSAKSVNAAIEIITPVHSSKPVQNATNLLSFSRTVAHSIAKKVNIQDTKPRRSKLPLENTLKNKLEVAFSTVETANLNQYNSMRSSLSIQEPNSAGTDLNATPSPEKRLVRLSPTKQFQVSPPTALRTSKTLKEFPDSTKKYTWMGAHGNLN